MFGRACRAGVDRVHVHFKVVGNVAADHGTLDKVDVVQPVADPRGVVQILHRAFAVAASVGFHHMHSSTGGAVVHAGARQVQIMQPVAAVQGQGAVGARDRVLDQRAGKADAPVGTLDGPRSRQIGHTGQRRVCQTDAFQRVQCGAVDAQDIRIAQRFVLATGHAGADGAQVVGQRGRACRTARGAAAGARGRMIVHDEGFRLQDKGQDDRGKPLQGLPRAARPRSAPMVRTTRAILHRSACIPVSLPERAKPRSCTGSDDPAPECGGFPARLRHRVAIGPRRGIAHPRGFLRGFPP